MMSEILQVLAPQAILVLTALAVLGLGVSVPKARKPITAATLFGGLLAAGSGLLFPMNGSFLHGMVAVDPLSRMFQLVILALALVAVVYAADTFPERHFAESLALILFGAVGMMLLCATDDLLMIFLALELTSIPLYVLAAFQKSGRSSAEAGLKYFLIGSVSAAFLLYGFSLIYGVTGSTHLAEIARFSGPADPLLLIGIALALGGLAFKVAAVPFQLWAPDVYEGAPTAAAALIASGSKVAGIFLLAKLLTSAFPPWAGSPALPGWSLLLALIAAASIVLGNIAALVQSNVKRLLAYSAIAHAGYLLLGLASGQPASFVAVLFYVVVYAITTAGAFGLVLVVERERGGSRVDDFNGLARSSPALAICLLVFLASLAGIPPLAGFFGKFFLFSSALGNPGMLWLVVLALAANAISLYYYLIVLKHVFVVPGPACMTARSSASRIVVAVLALAVLALGFFPNLLLSPLERAAHPAAVPSQTP